VKKSSRDEPIGVVINTCMKTTQRIYLCSYLCRKLAKKPYFFFYLLCFFVPQSQRTGRHDRFCPEWGGQDLSLVGGRKLSEKGRKINMMQIMYTHVCKCKTLPVETVLGISGGGIKESMKGVEFKYGIFDTL
jgi:hypothetical protein